MSNAKPVMQATITGRSAVIITPAGTLEQLSAGAGQDVRNVVISRAYREAIALGRSVEILTAGDQGEFHFVIDTHGVLTPVAFSAEPELPEREPSPVSAPVRLAAQDGPPPGPMRKPPADPIPATRFAELEDEFEETVLVRRRALSIQLIGADAPAIVGNAIVGRRSRSGDPGATVLIDDPTNTVSRQHIRLETTGEEAWITDLGSANGTSITNPEGVVELVPHQQYPLNDGDTLMLGDLSVVARIDGGR